MWRNIGIYIGTAITSGFMGYFIKEWDPLRRYREKRDRILRILSFNKEKPIQVIIAESFSGTGAEGRLYQATKSGQINALCYLLPEIHKRYKKDIEFRFGGQFSRADAPLLSKNLLLLGGPITNKFTEEITNQIFGRLRAVFGYTLQGKLNKDTFDNHSIYEVVSPHTKLWDATTSDLALDSGMIINLPSTGDTSNRTIIVAGCHSEGTAIAAKYLVDNANNIAEKIDLKNMHKKSRYGYQIIVKGTILNNEVLGIQTIKVYNLYFD